MVVAKDDYVHLALAAQFRKRVTQKTYLALARGNPVRDKGMIEAKIGRSPTNGKKMSRGGSLSRNAITRYEVLKRWEDWCLLKLYPLTGRTHQIRLHLQSINCFLVGDSLYGGKRCYDFPCRIERPMLHALTLGFFHPRRGKWMELEAPLPPDIRGAIDCLEEM
jgi:23S rRNA pseudouridine1911/1915/1917 synthase